MYFTIHSPRAAYPTPAVFLDRDGTINVEKNYLYRIEDWEWIQGAQESIRRLRNAGFMVVVVSNQAGVARGIYPQAEVEKLHAFVQADLALINTKIDGFYYCPHHPDFGQKCRCRKPSPEMILDATKNLNLDLQSSWMIGDKLIDVKAGEAAGIKSLLVKTGHGANEFSALSNGTKAFDSISIAACFILDQTLTHEA
jgi:D-glycero-D-manno-heptose 1,7-bisphosphate phosphatase